MHALVVLVIDVFASQAVGLRVCRLMSTGFVPDTPEQVLYIRLLSGIPA